MPPAKEPTILTINGSDTRGGAATVAWNLFHHYEQRNLDSWYLVQHKFSNHNRVIKLEHERYYNWWRKAITATQSRALADYGQKPGVWRMAKSLDWMAKPETMINRELGREEFNFPATQHILDLIPKRPDIVHAHVLHGGYFDLRFLPALSKQVPVVFTLHDAWMLAGHCAHSFECERWKVGCGQCPDLTIPTPIKRDGSAFNWKVKRDVYEKSKLYVSTPCQWLMNKVQNSILNLACVQTKVIPYGVDQTIFKPGNKVEARKRLSLPEDDTTIFLFSANGIRRNRWKDFELMQKALHIYAEGNDAKVIFLALGDTAEPIQVGNAQIRFLPYRSDPHDVADFYRAADVYLHAANADTFPNAVLEAICCGTPVIGTNVGGIPEQVRGWGGIGFLTHHENHYDNTDATGVLVPRGDAIAFARAMKALTADWALNRQLSENALQDARERYTIDRQVDTYLEWYREILTSWNNDATA